MCGMAKNKNKTIFSERKEDIRQDKVLFGSFLDEVLIGELFL